MLNKNQESAQKSKLSKALNQIKENTTVEKIGFVTTKNKASEFKTKSFKFRQEDWDNLIKICNYVNKMDTRKDYLSSQIIRGLINYLSDNMDKNYKKLIHYIQTSS